MKFLNSKTNCNPPISQGTVVKILQAKNAASTGSATADTSKEEAEIDRLVYQLYGLTEEEIKIVEGK